MYIATSGMADRKRNRQVEYIIQYNNTTISTTVTARRKPAMEKGQEQYPAEDITTASYLDSLISTARDQPCPGDIER